jgi:hypothetical protein
LARRVAGAADAAGGRVRMLWQHDPAQPVGVWTEISEDQRGLFCRGALNLDVQRLDDFRRIRVEGREAAQPFETPPPIDAINAALVDEIFYNPFSK